MARPTHSRRGVCAPQMLYAPGAGVAPWRIAILRVYHRSLVPKPYCGLLRCSERTCGPTDERSFVCLPSSTAVRGRKRWSRVKLGTGCERNAADGWLPSAPHSLNSTPP